MVKSLAYEKAFNFSIKIINLYEYLNSEKREYTLSKQILRSGTSIGANIKEALQASSKKDFLMKMNIALKEASETEYWLDILHETNFFDTNLSESTTTDCKELIKILVSIVKTTKENLKLTI